MKRINKMKRIVISCMILLGLSGCYKLEQLDPNQQTEESFWQTEDDLYRGVIAVYDQLQDRNMYSAWMRLLPTYISDESTNFDTFEYGNLTRFTSSLVDPALDIIWYQNYKLIGRAYQVIDREANIGTPGAASIAAEAKFLVALAYYNLIVSYGENIAYVDRIQTPDDRPRRAEDDELWSLCENYLLEAIELLPTSYPIAQYGRITSGAAKALLAKIHMQQRDYVAAEPLLREIIDSGFYQLNANFEDNFIENVAENPESIFQVNFRPFGSPEENEHNTAFREVGIGENLTVQIWGGMHCTKLVPQSFLDEPDKDGNRDPRMDATVFSEFSDLVGRTYYGRTHAQWISENSITGDAEFQEIEFNTTFYKYQESINVIQAINSGSTQDPYLRGGIDFIVIRYADILLLHAEALNELGQTSEAHSVVNLVRARSNMNDLEVTAGGELSQADFREQIKHERLLELAYENVRYYDQKRWNDFGPQVINQFRIPATGTLVDRDADYLEFDIGKDELLAIPLREIQLNPNLQQNPGW